MPCFWYFSSYILTRSQTKILMNKDVLDAIKDGINKAPQKVTLVAVTKSVGIEETNEVIKAGVSAIGENRVEDFERKFPQLLPIEKHFIGQIQSRKIKRIVELFDVIQSVSSIEYLKKIDAEALAQVKPTKVLLQFNISGEVRKGGFKQDELGNNSLPANSRELIGMNQTISTTHHIKIIGVMGMATNTEDGETVRKQFRRLKDIRDQLRARFPEIIELSMGMSNDYKIALEEGATMLRIGRALFFK